MSHIRSTIACNLDSNILSASLPLFATEKVEAIEWSFDTLFHFPQVPPWFLELLTAFSAEDRLIGHGVFFSLFSGRWNAEQTDWLKGLETLSQQYNFDHITEHFGFMTGKNFHQGAPLPIPFNKTTLAIGQDRLKRISAAAKCPVGLENLAFSYTIEEVKRHGTFLHNLLEPINGFIILDIHNLYCQLHNFDMSYNDLMALYPLDMVREIHISGGSWESTEANPDKKIRRDTHDDGVPKEVFNMLEKTIPVCPNLKYVVLEQIGLGLKTEASKVQFRNDFDQMHQIVQKQNRDISKIENDFQPILFDSLSKPIEDSKLAKQQEVLSQILETANDFREAQQWLNESSLANSDWKTEDWDAAMLETAVAIAQKWKGGF